MMIQNENTQIRYYSITLQAKIKHHLHERTCERHSLHTRVFHHEVFFVCVVVSLIELNPIPVSVTSATFSLKSHSQHSLLSENIFPHRRPNHEGLSSCTHGLIYISCTFTGIFHWLLDCFTMIWLRGRTATWSQNQTAAKRTDTKTFIRNDDQNGSKDSVEKSTDDMNEGASYRPDTRWPVIIIEMMNQRQLSRWDVKMWNHAHFITVIYTFVTYMSSSKCSETGQWVHRLLMSAVGWCCHGDDVI